VASEIGRRLVLPIAVLAVLVGAGAFARAQQLDRSGDMSIVGIARQTEVHIGAEKNGRLVELKVSAGQKVKKGDVLAILSSPDLSASAAQSRAAEQQAGADRTNVYAGVRKEQVDIARQNIQICEANVTLAKQEYDRAVALSEKDFASKQRLDEATNGLRNAQSALDTAKAQFLEDQNGPTIEERAIADTKLALAKAKTVVVDAALAKTQILAPFDGFVVVIVARKGEVVLPGQTILTLSPPDKIWFSFTAREDALAGLTVGSTTTIGLSTGASLSGRITEMLPLGEFATWRAAKAVGDHDLNSFLLRVDTQEPTTGIEPGMSVWLKS